MQQQISKINRELLIRNYSPETIKSYLRGLGKYFLFKKKDFEILDIENIKNFLLSLEN